MSTTPPARAAPLPVPGCPAHNQPALSLTQRMGRRGREIHHRAHAVDLGGLIKALGLPPVHLVGSHRPKSGNIQHDKRKGNCGPLGSR